MKLDFKNNLNLNLKIYFIIIILVTSCSSTRKWGNKEFEVILKQEFEFNKIPLKKKPSTSFIEYANGRQVELNEGTNILEHPKTLNLFKIFISVYGSRINQIKIIDTLFYENKVSVRLWTIEKNLRMINVTTTDNNGKLIHYSEQLFLPRQYSYFDTFFDSLGRPETEWGGRDKIKYRNH